MNEIVEAIFGMFVSFSFLFGCVYIKVKYDEWRENRKPY